MFPYPDLAHDFGKLDFRLLALRRRYHRRNRSGENSLEKTTGIKPILDLILELQEQLKLETMRRDTYALTLNVQRELQSIKQRYGTWKEKYARVCKKYNL